MKISDKGLALLKKFEGCRLQTYLDSVGVPTIGYGSTGPHVTPGLTISPARAESLLREDLVRFEKCVNACTAGLGISQSQFDALVCFSFNVGTAALEGSTLLKRLKAGDKKGAADGFLSWTKAGGKTLKGLVVRRAAERDLFLSEAA